MIDRKTIATRLLHDVVEDTIMTLDQLTKVWFRGFILVDGLTQLSAGTDEWRFRQITLASRSLPWLRISRHHHKLAVPPAQHAHGTSTGKTGQKEKKKTARAMEYAYIARQAGYFKIKTD